MRILIVANINSSHTKKWVLALKNKQIAVALFSINAPSQAENWYKNLTEVYYPENNQRNLFLKYVSLYFQLKKMISRFNPDILHSHFITNYSLLANLTGFKKHIITAWGSDVFVFPKKNFFNRFILKFNLWCANSIISTSHVMAEEIKRYTKKNVSVIPFGIDFSLFTPKQNKTLPKDHTITIACIKKIEKIYATEILISAFYLLQKKMSNYQLKLLLAGNGSKLNEMKSLVKKLGIEKKVDFLGWVDSDNIPTLLQGVDICVYLSRNESFGVSLIEAMAVKIPLIVTKTPGFMEVIHDPSNALFVNFNDSEQTAAKMEALILNSKDYFSMTNSAYNHALKNYQLDNNIDAQINLYKKIIIQPV